MEKEPVAPKFIPALRFDWLTPMYDNFLQLTMPEQIIKKALITEANISKGFKVLDFGCGSGTLTVMMKTANPLTRVTGVDIDENILDKAKKKISDAKLDIKLVNYNGTRLPLDDASFDRVLSCLVFHHIYGTKKEAILQELFRVLKNGGQLLIADFGRSESAWQRFKFNLIRGLDGFESTEANAKGKLPQLIIVAGFKKVSIVKHFKTMFGEVQIIMAKKD